MEKDKKEEINKVFELKGTISYKNNSLKKLYIERPNPTTLIDFLFVKSNYSKTSLKKSIICGGCWIRKGGKGPLKRVYRVQYDLKEDDYIEFYFNEKIVSIKPSFEKIFSLSENKDFGVWFKPHGIHSQGTPYSDHTSMLRYLVTEKKIETPYLIHRLDSDIEGIMAVGYTPKGASELSKLWADGKVKKGYMAICLGDLTKKLEQEIKGLPSEQKPLLSWTKQKLLGEENVLCGIIYSPLDGKIAETHFKIESYDSKLNCTLVKIGLITGRFHQIRRHFQKIGFPILGDLKHGFLWKNISGERRENFRKIFSVNDTDEKFITRPCLASYLLSFKGQTYSLDPSKNQISWLKKWSLK